MPEPSFLDVEDYSLSFKRFLFQTKALTKKNRLAVRDGQPSIVTFACDSAPPHHKPALVAPEVSWDIGRSVHSNYVGSNCFAFDRSVCSLRQEQTCWSFASPAGSSELPKGDTFLRDDFADVSELRDDERISDNFVPDRPDRNESASLSLEPVDHRPDGDTSCPKHYTSQFGDESTGSGSDHMLICYDHNNGDRVRSHFGSPSHRRPCGPDLHYADQT